LAAADARARSSRRQLPITGSAHKAGNGRRPLRAAIATARSARRPRRGNGSKTARSSCCRFPTTTSSSPCRRRSAGSSPARAATDLCSPRTSPAPLRLRLNRWRRPTSRAASPPIRPPMPIGRSPARPAPLRHPQTRHCGRHARRRRAPNPHSAPVAPDAHRPAVSSP
jgi:hypothetical protein